MHTFARGLYGLIGALALAAASVVLVWPSAIVTPEQPGVVTHLLQEQAALFVFVGLMCFWCVRHFSQRQPVHAALFVFVVLFAAVHWWGVLFEGDAPSLGGYATLVPVALFAAIWPRGLADAQAR